MKMVLADRQTSSAMDSMPQTVPSAGFTPPCDYTTFAENFDLSLLTGEDQPLSPSSSSSIQFYPICDDNDKCDDPNNQPKIFTTFYPNSPLSDSQSLTDAEFQPDFQKLFSSSGSDENKNYLSPQSPIHLEVPSVHQPNSLGSLSPYSSGLLSPNDQFGTYREHSFYPSSPEYSLYTASPSSSIYSKSPCEEYLHSGSYIKQEILSASTSPLPHLSPFGIKEENYMTNFSLSPVSPPSATSSSYSNLPSSPEHNNNNNNILISTSSQEQKIIKQESTVDFSEILGNLQSTDQTLRGILNQPIQTNNNNHQTTETPKDHQLLRQFLRDTSFQKKYNIQPNIDFAFVNNNNNNNNSDIKMEEPEVISSDDLIIGEEISRESIEPVLNMAIEQMRKDVDDTCTLLGISPDPSKWSPSDVISWIRWTSRQFNCTEPEADSWTMSGVDLLALAEKDFANRVPQGGMILYAQLEIWKAAYSEEKMKNWNPDNAASNASTISGDISEDEDEDQTHSASDSKKPTTSSSSSSRTGSHIHLWQFLKELLQNSQNHGSCIRWLDRTKGIFKIEDSVKVARLWGKRKNRPAMNYDKLSRSIRQYYKKGIMKKTERSQRLVYQFCHPYNL